jgi:hypothetical protein
MRTILRCGVEPARHLTPASGHRSPRCGEGLSPTVVAHDLLALSQAEIVALSAAGVV